ncbi:hypothetical protein Back2_06900 [Nocardioides baekrokdamisoli]|uniref:KANL3/Tex30 alpha/beta hydrolase-like domain-containing protein n=1 Tax=Nocardioides baekrokdamisoli TaxID=1804624 RepID=A0A3G9IVQ8_9ACTN|nr:alpha/beta family hydrolase [Nocardioides baekrokdamisoli]BBH16403.1 hypothetical protein Back2_06900 [Nocardioides baekrokdamisoli]
MITVETPYGPGRLVVAQAKNPIGTLLLSHGAGNGIDTRDLEALAASLPGEGFAVARFEQPWRVAGRKVATAPATLDVGLKAAVASLVSTASTSGPLIVGGRSAGARSACRSARELGARGVLALAFPLHPPGKPEKSRKDELAAGVPVLVVQGANDPMGRPDDFPERTEIAVVPFADHGFKVAARAPITQTEALDLIVEATLEWLVREIVGSGRE